MSRATQRRKLRPHISVPKRIRARRKRRIKATFGLNRRDAGRFGAGHATPPRGYERLMYMAKVVAP